jgi:hypothetical protein
LYTRSSSLQPLQCGGRETVYMGPMWSTVSFLYISLSLTQDVDHNIVAPIRKYVEYEPTYFKMTETSKDYGLVGQPSEELDKKWSNIMQYFYAEIPKEYMEKLGRTQEGIRLPNGNYLANYAFIHQLHCLVWIYTPFFVTRYPINATLETSIPVVLPGILLAWHDRGRNGATARA